MDLPVKFFLIAIAFIGTAVPSVFVLNAAGGLEGWQGIMPRGATDSLYYYGRMHEVLDGHPLIGNPYAYEHRDAIAPAFVLPDIISALPMLLGLPFGIGVIVNLFVWSLAYLALAYVLLRLCKVPRTGACIGAAFTYLVAYSFILRPTVMQLVYPTFLAFSIAYLHFLYEPSKKHIWWLAATASLTFYVYTYAAYVVILTLATAFLLSLTRRRWSEIKNFLWLAGLSALFLIPFGIYTVSQMSDPFYFETLVRIGLVYTHLPSIEVYYYGRWVVFAVMTSLLIWFASIREWEPRTAFWVTSGIGLLSALSLNLFTGVELTLGVHVGRIVLAWMTLASCALFWQWHSASGSRIFRLAALTPLLLLVVGVTANVPRGLSFFSFEKRGDTVAEIQPYAAPLAWLADIQKESVVWANESFSTYIPVHTHHYPLFHLDTGLHRISNRELEDRYLLSRSLGDLTVEDLKREFDQYGGAGASFLQAVVENEKVGLCRLIARISPRTCPPYTDGVTMRGEDYFRNLAVRFEVIRIHQDVHLQRFHVEYIVLDRERDRWTRPVPGAKVYDDERFAIFAII